MAKTKTAKHPSGDLIIFDPKWHTFKAPRHAKVKFTSGTRFIKDYFVPFDREGISKMVAKKRGVTQESLLLEWDTKGLVSREAGTLVHGYVESIILRRPPLFPVKEMIEDKKAIADPIIMDKIMNLADAKCKTGKLAAEEILDTYEIVGVENIVASITSGIATLVDLQAINKATRQHAVLDWKTNEKIDFSSFKNKCGFGPCAEVEDCNYSHYSIQMGITDWILRNEGYINKNAAESDLNIIHLDLDDYNIIPTVNMTDVLDAMMADRMAKGITWDDFNAAKAAKAAPKKKAHVVEDITGLMAS